MFKVMCMACRVPHDLLRHAANIDAGAPEPPIFDERDLRAILRGAARMRNTAAAAADHDEIKMLFHTGSSGLAIAPVV